MVAVTAMTFFSYFFRKQKIPHESQKISSSTVARIMGVERWVYQALQASGVAVQKNVVIGRVSAAVAIPEKKVALFFFRRNDCPLERVTFHKQARELQRHGWRITTIRRESFYRDFTKVQRLLET